MEKNTYGIGQQQKEFGRMLLGDAKDAAPQPLQGATLERRLDDYTRIADSVSRLAARNPYGALHLIEQLEPHEQTPALYGIVAQGIAEEISAAAVHHPEQLALYQNTPMYVLAQRMLAYCDSKMSALDGTPASAPSGDKPYTP